MFDNEFGQRAKQEDAERQRKNAEIMRELGNIIKSGNYDNFENKNKFIIHTRFCRKKI